ncbi:MAG TPA: pitrilysin family protein [Myxococcota bacterium]|nr:pitrilysin family protein [Myxococcota bacterium]
MKLPNRVTLGLVFAAALGGGCALFAPKPAWLQPPPPIYDGPIVEAGKLHRTTLENGLHVIVLEDFRLPRVALGVAVRRGAASDPIERAGLATYTAEVMERGAGDRDAFAFAQAVDDIGASFDVSADWDSMSVTLSGLSRDFDTLFSLLRDVTLKPRFDKAEAERARAEQLAGLESQKDDPSALARIHFAKLLYPEHRFGRPLAGTPEAVSGFDAAAAREVHRQNFAASNAILFVAGDVHADDFFSRAREAFGAWPAGEAPPLPPPPPAIVPGERRIVIVDRPELGQAQIVLGHEGIARTTPTRFSDTLMNNVLGGGGFSSRLMASVRAEAGLTYSVSSGFSVRRAPGPFAVSTFTRVPESRRVIDLVLQQLEHMKQDPPSESELRDAKSETAGGFALGFETSEAIVAALVSIDVQGLPENALDTYRASIRAVTTADTAASARDRLHPERAGIVIVGPGATLAPALESLGQVSVEKP